MNKKLKINDIVIIVGSGINATEDWSKRKPTVDFPMHLLHNYWIINNIYTYNGSDKEYQGGVYYSLTGSCWPGDYLSTSLQFVFRPTLEKKQEDFKYHLDWIKYFHEILKTKYEKRLNKLRVKVCIEADLINMLHRLDSISTDLRTHEKTINSLS